MGLLRFSQKLNNFLDNSFSIRFTHGLKRRPTGIEDGAWDAMLNARSRTMATQLQQYSMWQSVKYICENDIAGAVIEFGVWRGGISMIARTAMVQFKKDLDQFLFDTFEGMPNPSELDIELSSNKYALNLLRATKKKEKRNGDYDIWCLAGIDDVKVGMEKIGSDSRKINYIQGDVLDTVPSSLPESIAICRIDTDWYESTAHLLKHCWPRIVHGGVLILDDYDYWKGARSAVDEFFERENLKPLMLRPDSGRLVIKY